MYAYVITSSSLSFYTGRKGRTVIWWKIQYNALRQITRATILQLLLIVYTEGRIMLVSDGQRRIGARWSVTDEALCEGRGGAGSLTVALCFKKKYITYSHVLLVLACLFTSIRSLCYLGFKNHSLKHLPPQIYRNFDDLIMIYTDIFFYGK